jgi:hypothetical protein
MKIHLLIFAVILTTHTADAQLKATQICPPIVVDVLGGSVNKLYPKSTLGEIQKSLPCYSEIVEADSTKCAGIFYKDQDIYFYPGRNYFEIRQNFKGKSTIAIGTSRSNLFSMLGNPKIKDITWDAFQTEYGTLVLYYDKAGKINKIQISSKSTESLKLCE